MDLHFATSNKHKFQEAEEILRPAGIKLYRYDFHYNEIRSDSLEEIAKDSLSAAHHQLKKPVFVEDAGLFIDSLNGFPGTYSGWVYGKVGVDGILNLLKEKDSRDKDPSKRTARFESCIAYTDGTKYNEGTKSNEGTKYYDRTKTSTFNAEKSNARIFNGICNGIISEDMRGEGGFGYDPIFIPEGKTQTFAQSIGLKNKLSHRYNSLLKFSKYLVEQSR